MSASNLPDDREADALYEHYGRRLEAEHWGEFVAIFPNGKIVVGPTPVEVVQEALAAVGRGSVLFKIGEKIVWKWR